MSLDKEIKALQEKLKQLKKEKKNTSSKEDKYNGALKYFVPFIEKGVEQIKSLRNDPEFSGVSSTLASNIKAGVKGLMYKWGDIVQTKYVSQAVVDLLTDKGLTIDDLGTSWHGDKELLGRDDNNKWVLMYEHSYPQDDLLEDLILGKFSAKEMLTEHYVISWITRDEDKAIKAWNRDGGWRNEYLDKGVILAYERVNNEWVKI